MAWRVFQVELPIRRDWGSIEPLRVSVLSCLRAVFPDQPLCDSLSMVATELLENALKYGCWTGSDAALFGLRVAGDDDEVEVAVSNPVDPSDPGLARLLSELDRIQAAPSPEDAYLERMRQVAVTPGAHGGLGLARIAHEGGCALSADVSPAGVLRVRAVTRRSSAPRSRPAA